MCSCSAWYTKNLICCKQIWNYDQTMSSCNLFFIFWRGLRHFIFPLAVANNEPKNIGRPCFEKLNENINFQNLLYFSKTLLLFNPKMFPFFYPDRKKQSFPFCPVPDRFKEANINQTQHCKICNFHRETQK